MYVCVLTTLRTRVRAAESPATKGLQSSTRYGFEITTASAMMILAPSHRAGMVRLNASKISCASRVTPLPRRASVSCSLATALASRAFRARVSSAWIGGASVSDDARERS
jgi:hypothetical protein